MDELLNYDAFFCIDNGRNINTGTGCGANINHISMKILLNDYKNQNFKLNGENNPSCSHVNTPIIQKEYPTLEKIDETQIIDNVIFLSSDDMGKISKHYGERNWLDDFDRSMVKKHGRFKKYFLKKIRNPKIFKFISNNIGNKSEKIYEFLVYDFFDLGIMYFIRKAIKKYT